MATHETWRETNEGGCGERAGGDQHEAAVELGLGAPVDSQGKGDGKGCYVQKGGPEQGRPAGEIGIEQVEAPHSDGGDGADYGDGNAEHDAEPPKRAMYADVAGADQGGLDDIQDHPGGEDADMDREKEWLAVVRVEEPLIDRWPEPADHDCCNQERHEKVEVLGQRASGLRRQCDFLDSQALGFDLQFVEFQKFLHNRLFGFFHLRVSAKEDRLAFVQKDDSVGEFLGEPHVVRDHDAG